MKYTSSFKDGIATHYIKDDFGNYWSNTSKAGEAPNPDPKFWAKMAPATGEAIWKEIMDWHESFGNDPMLSVFEIMPKNDPRESGDSSIIHQFKYDPQGDQGYWEFPDVALLNTTILTGGLEGFTRVETYPLNLSEVKEWISESSHVSHIGHESTAQVMSTLLGREIKMDRKPYTQGVGEFAIAFKLNGRAPEGQILTAEEIEAIGYSWVLMHRVK